MNVHVNTPYEIHDGETVRRAFTGPVIKSINKEERQIEFVISTAAKDRYGDIIVVSGWDLKMYRQNPVVLFGHNSSLPPIGKAIKTWKDGDALRSIAQFMPADMSAFADSIFRMYLEKYLNAVSVGFMPTKYEAILDEEGNPTYSYKFLKQELLEFSAVPVPANPEALVAARQKGIDTLPFKTWAEEMLDNWQTVNKDLSVLYGLGRKDLENIRRRAAGAGVAIQVPIEIQDDLLQRNLEAIRKSKAEKAAAKEFMTIDFGNEEYELPVRKLNPDETPGVFHYEVAIGENEKTIVTNISKADDCVVFDPSVVAAGYATLGSIFYEGNTMPLISFETEDRCVTYGFTGILTGTEAVEGKFVATKINDEEKKPEDAPKPAEEAPVPSSEETEPSDEEQDAPVVETEEPASPAETEETPETVDEEEKSLDEHGGGERLAAGIGFLKELDEDFLCRMQILEGVLDEFETALEQHSNPTKLEERKKQFLALCMRQLADRLDGGQTVVKMLSTATPKASITPAEPVKDDKAGFATSDDVRSYLKNVTDQLQPMLAEIISSKLAKMRGRLD